MLAVPTFKLGNPVLLVILVIADNAFLHAVVIPMCPTYW